MSVELELFFGLGLGAGVVLIRLCRGYSVWPRVLLGCREVSRFPWFPSDLSLPYNALGSFRIIIQVQWYFMLNCSFNHVEDSPSWRVPPELLFTPGICRWVYVWVCWVPDLKVYPSFPYTWICFGRWLFVVLQVNCNSPCLAEHLCGDEELLSFLSWNPSRGFGRSSPSGSLIRFLVPFEQDLFQLICRDFLSSRCSCFE